MITFIYITPLKTQVFKVLDRKRHTDIEDSTKGTFSCLYKHAVENMRTYV